MSCKCMTSYKPRIPTVFWACTWAAGREKAYSLLSLHSREPGVLYSLKSCSLMVVGERAGVRGSVAG